jgi:hypothetical protein
VTTARPQSLSSESGLCGVRKEPSHRGPTLVPAIEHATRVRENLVAAIEQESERKTNRGSGADAR